MMPFAPWKRRAADRIVDAEEGLSLSMSISLIAFALWRSCCHHGVPSLVWPRLFADC